MRSGTALCMCFTASDEHPDINSIVTNIPVTYNEYEKQFKYMENI